MAGAVRPEGVAPLASLLQRHRGAARTAFFLASRDLLKDRKVAALVVCVLAFSFINMIFFTSFQYGLQSSFEEQLVGTFTSHVTIQPKENQKHIENVDSVVDKLRVIPGVVATATTLEDSGIQLHFKGEQVGAHLEAVVPSEFAAVSTIPNKVSEGSFLGDGDTGTIVLGAQLVGTGNAAEEFDFGFGLGAKVGDKVRVRFSNGVEREYRIKGVVESGAPASDFNAYLTRKEFESVFPETKGKASDVMVRLSDRRQAAEYKTLFLAEGIREEIQTWEDTAGFIRQISGSMSIIAGVTGGVGVITVAVTMAIVIYINTTHKRRLMGVLKAIGATDGVVFRVFIYEAVLFGLLGIAVGVALSQVMAAAFARNPIPVPIGGGVVPDIRPELLALGSLTVLLSGLLAAYYPSWRAARQPIVASIWG
ncbi:MAG: FtsX-like permease family protein [Halobacteria archaeon]